MVWRQARARALDLTEPEGVRRWTVVTGSVAITIAFGLSQAAISMASSVTLNVPAIIAKGAEWFRSVGTEKSPGFKLFAVSGHVERPGIYEAPLGTTSVLVVR